MSPASQFASSTGLRLSHQRQLSFDSQYSAGSTSSHALSPRHEQWSPPKSRNITPASSVDTTSQGGASKSSSRTSSSEHASLTSNMSNMDESEPDVSTGELDDPKFLYSKIKTSIIPEGWSNDPKKLQPIYVNISCESFGLEDLGPLLVSTADDGDPRCLLWYGSKFYFWHTVSEKLFYVTKSYELQGILRRMKGTLVELPTKELARLPRECFEPSEDYLKLPPNQVPNGWSNRFEDFDDLRQKVDSQERGLELPLPILASFHLDCQFFQSGNRHYLYNQISSDVFRVEEPVRLQEILRILINNTSCQGLTGLKLENMERLLEYGGPSRVPDNDVPEGWTNIVDPKFIDHTWCHGWKLSLILSTLLYSDSYLDGTPAYLFESKASLRSSNYLWKPSLNAVYRIDEVDGLSGILAVLGNPSRKLELTLLEPLPGTESYRVADDEMPTGWIRAKNRHACKSMPGEKHGLAFPTPVLQRTGPCGDIAEYLVEAGKGILSSHFYLWNAVSNDIYRVRAALGLESIFNVLDCPSGELKLEKVGSKKAASWWQLLKSR